MKEEDIAFRDEIVKEVDRYMRDGSRGYINPFNEDKPVHWRTTREEALCGKCWKQASTFFEHITCPECLRCMRRLM